MVWNEIFRVCEMKYIFRLGQMCDWETRLFPANLFFPFWPNDAFNVKPQKAKKSDHPSSIR